MLKRVYRKTAWKMSSYLILLKPEHRPDVVYARYRGSNPWGRLYHKAISNPTHTKLVEAEQQEGFVSFFIRERI